MFSKKSVRAFTLIELLIVIAIILILIAIALPNFLEAQERARITKAKAVLRTNETGAMAFFTDNQFFYSDFNDPPKRKTRNRGSSVLNVPCPLNEPPPGSVRSKGGLEFINDAGGLPGEYQLKYNGPGLHCPLTSPVRYVELDATREPWSDGSVSMGYDTLYFGDNSPEDIRGIRLGVYFASGPDKITGHREGNCPAWKGCPPCDPGKAMVFNPTNGTKSCGDLWVVVTTNTAQAKLTYNPLRTF
ncbi:MAG: prepilin-type N-terminal cleavage/methylation domain-containing protein [Candidatus Omnitrophica bacterium]|nr:hypothetical protein [bacterium]NUN94809.1 prepilin-type N-terminal cleavage/methylation domain-containing protein [Candidatus Omnitrophota bacterium]